MFNYPSHSTPLARSTEGVLATALQEHVAGFRVWTWVSTHFSGDGSKGHSRLALILRAIIFL